MLSVELLGPDKLEGHHKTDTLHTVMAGLLSTGNNLSIFIHNFFHWIVCSPMLHFSALVVT